ncbi:hypothetical protein [Treponema vincentii]
MQDKKTLKKINQLLTD